MGNAINFQDIIIAPSVRETASEDGAVLLDIEQGICFSLNPVGLRIWKMLAQRLSLDEIVDSLEREFHTARPELVTDICDFVRTLEAKNLIRHGVFAPAKHGWLANLLLARTGTSHR
jgi:hypothetical protein